MNQADFQLRTQTDGVLHLQEAVLIYRGGQGAAFATVHDIAHVDGEPTILAGKAMTPRAAITLARDLSQGVRHGGFIPETVLYLDGDLLLWWAPPMQRHIAFRSTNMGATDGNERGETVPHPGLVFAASGSVWSVWAVKSDQRPTPDTTLYQAPYFNVWEGGRICQGNVQMPDGTTAEKIDAWNAAFFGSFFTHPNIRKNLLRYRGGSIKFWRDMLDGKFARFPEKVLVPLDATLRDLLGGKGGSDDRRP